MINYLKGNLIEIIKDTKNRIILIMEVNQIGYELQITSKLEQKLYSKKLNYIRVFIHLQMREDCQVLYGFINITISTHWNVFFATTNHHLIIIFSINPFGKYSHFSRFTFIT